MSTIAQWQLRRLASRTLRVFKRHEPTEPAIASHGGSTVPAAQGFIETYDRARAFNPVWGQELREGRTLRSVLLRKVQGWAVQVQIDVPSFDASKIGDRPEVADDVVSDAKTVIDTVDAAVARGQELHYAEALKADLQAAMEPLLAEVEQAGDAHAEYTKQLAEAREAAALFQTHLVAFRRTLAIFIGRSHPDFQKLRAARARMVDADDDETAASLPDTDEPIQDAVPISDDDLDNGLADENAAQ